MDFGQSLAVLQDDAKQEYLAAAQKIISFEQINQALAGLRSINEAISNMRNGGIHGRCLVKM